MIFCTALKIKVDSDASRVSTVSDGNSLGRVSDVDWNQGTTNLDEYQYGYDRDSNTLSRDNVTRGLTQFYSYDNLNELASATDPDTTAFPATTWQLDSMGNRVGTEQYNANNEDITDESSNADGDTEKQTGTAAYLKKRN